MTTNETYLVIYYLDDMLDDIARAQYLLKRRGDSEEQDEREQENVAKERLAFGKRQVFNKRLSIS